MKKILMLAALMGLFQVPIGCNPCGNFPSGVLTTQNMEAVVGLPFDYQGDLAATHVGAATVKVNVTEAEFLTAAAAPRWNIISAAYACSPAPYDYEQYPTAISLTATDTLYIGGDSLLPGQELNDFWIDDSRHYDPTTLDNALLEYAQGLRYWDGFGLGEGVVEEVMGFRLAQAPDQAIDTDIRVAITLSDGQEYALTAEGFVVDSW